jgi:hypothetical protein
MHLLATREHRGHIFIDTEEQPTPTQSRASLEPGHETIHHPDEAIFIATRRHPETKVGYYDGVGKSGSNTAEELRWLLQRFACELTFSCWSCC